MIRPDIHARFQRVLKRADERAARDKEIANRPTEGSKITRRRKPAFPARFKKEE